MTIFTAEEWKNLLSENNENKEYPQLALKETLYFIRVEFHINSVRDDNILAELENSISDTGTLNTENINIDVVQKALTLASDLLNRQIPDEPFYCDGTVVSQCKNFFKQLLENITTELKKRENQKNQGADDDESTNVNSNAEEEKTEPKKGNNDRQKGNGFFNDPYDNGHKNTSGTELNQKDDEENNRKILEEEIDRIISYSS